MRFALPAALLLVLAACAPQTGGEVIIDDEPIVDTPPVVVN